MTRAWQWLTRHISGVCAAIVALAGVIAIAAASVTGHVSLFNFIFWVAVAMAWTGIATLNNRTAKTWERCADAAERKPAERAS